MALYKKIKIEANEMHYKGCLQTSGLPAPSGEWAITREWHPCTELDVEVKSLIGELHSKKDFFSECILEQDLVGFFCFAIEVFSKRYPILRLSSSTIAQLAEMQTEFSIDWYDYSEYHYGVDELKTLVSAKGFCVNSNMDDVITYNAEGMEGVSLEEIIRFVLLGLKRSASLIDSAHVNLIIFVEVHNEENPLLVLPLSLLSELTNLNASLEINWKRIS